MGQSIAIKGELSGAEDLTLEGQVDGKINLPDNVLTVGTSARINAEVVAKADHRPRTAHRQRDGEGEVRAARWRVDAGQREGAAHRDGRRRSLQRQGRDAGAKAVPGRSGHAPGRGRGQV